MTFTTVAQPFKLLPLTIIPGIMADVLAKLTVLPFTLVGV